jgi:hypothetical protein
MRVMSTTLGLYDDTDEWPALALVQNTMVEHHDLVDVKRAAKRLPGGFVREGQEGAKVELTFRGIFEAEPNHPLVDDFERTLRVVTRRYKSRQDPKLEATIGVADLTETLVLDEHRVRRALDLLRAEGLVSAGADRTSFRIRPEIRHFIRVRDAAAYVKVRAKRDRQRCRARKARKTREATIGDHPGIRKVIVGALGSLLAAGVLWLGNQAVFSGGDSRTHQSKSGPARSAEGTGRHAGRN